MYYVSEEETFHLFSTQSFAYASLLPTRSVAQSHRVIALLSPSKQRGWQKYLILISNCDQILDHKSTSSYIP